MLLLSDDVELNPGPRRNSNKCFSICQWNFNSVSVKNYLKPLLLKAYIAGFPDSETQNNKGIQDKH